MITLSLEYVEFTVLVTLNGLARVRAIHVAVARVNVPAIGRAPRAGSI